MTVHYLMNSTLPKMHRSFTPVNMYSTAEC